MNLLWETKTEIKKTQVQKPTQPVADICQSHFEKSIDLDSFFHNLLKWQGVIGVISLSHKPTDNITFIIHQSKHATSAIWTFFAFQV